MLMISFIARARLGLFREASAWRLPRARRSTLRPRRLVEPYRTSGTRLAR
jgi:hypothetical protein